MNTLLRLTILMSVAADPLSAADRALHELIDENIAARWAEREIVPAERSDDAEFARRVWLDLAGTIPTPDDVRVFLADESPDKREVLIERLLDSPNYARHMQHVFDVMLMERLPGGFLTDREWQQYLHASFADNKPWDQLVRELVGADGNDPASRGAIRWLMIRNYGGRQRLVSTKIARDIGRMFLGINLQCAECHDHPHIEDYRQADFYGLAAFVNRTTIVNVRRNKRGFLLLAENADGEAKFKSVFDPKSVEKTTRPHLPGAVELDEPTFEEGGEYEIAPESGVQQVPRYSRRARLAQLLPSADNALFKRNIANRLWKLMFGRGLVDPVDLHHTANPASHPQLLDALADRFAAQSFDIKWFLRELALSRTYQLSSALPPGTKVPADSFAAAPFKALRPRQLMFAVLQASGTTDVVRRELAEKANEAALYKKLIEHADSFARVYGRPAGQPDVETDPSVPQALFLSNSPVVMEWIRRKDGNLVDRLTAMDDAAAIIEELYLAVYSRMPTDDESAMLIEYLSSPSEIHPELLQECVWALIASAEFRFNH